MKKVCLLIVLLIILSGCGKKTLEERFVDMTKEYYEKVFEKAIDDDVIEVKITLKNLSVYGYDLKDFENCDEDSSVIFKLEMKNKKKIIKDKTVDLICNKTDD